MNKRLQAYMEAETNTMVDDLLKETIDQAEEGEVIVIGDRSSQGKSKLEKELNQLVEVRLDYEGTKEVPLRHQTISTFLEKVFDSDRFTNTYDNRSAWRTGEKETRLAGMLYFEGITYHGFRFSYAFDKDSRQVVLNFIPADIIRLGGTLPQEDMP